MPWILMDDEGRVWSVNNVQQKNEGGEPLPRQEQVPESDPHVKAMISGAHEG